VSDEDELPAWSEPFAGSDHGRLTRGIAVGALDRDWAWGGSTGAGVTVAIIDSGLEVSHPALHGRVVESVAVEMVDGEPKVVPDDGADMFGHATACGGIILGLAPEVELVSIRVLGADLRGKGAAFAEGLDWAIERRVQVANLSLSSRSEAMYPVFHELADEAYFHNVALVSAANNVPGPSYPSLFSSVFSVAAHAEPDPHRFYYNPTPPVEWGAWGVDVPIAWKDGGTTVATGNSFAAPHIAGIVALILSKHPGLTPFEVKAILAAVADNPRRGAGGAKPRARRPAPPQPAPGG
jgi:subtilisin family serine protease